MEQEVQTADEDILHATEVLGTEQPLWLYLDYLSWIFRSRIQNPLVEEQPVLPGKNVRWPLPSRHVLVQAPDWD